MGEQGRKSGMRIHRPCLEELQPETPGLRRLYRRAIEFLRQTEGSAILEFAITIPLLVVFVVGIYDFSGAFNQKQKIEQAAQQGAIVAGAQQTSDIYTANTNPDSLLPVVTAVFTSLTGSNVIPTGTCAAPGTVTPPSSGLTWTYTISGCNGAYLTDNLVISVNRGWTAPGSTSTPTVVGTVVTVSYPYHWRFNSVIQLLIPGASYQATTTLIESATVHNQM
jgi:Flp pilus assembly protein TadG